MKAAIARLPEWVRKFAVDAIEGGVASVLVLGVAFPTSVADAQKVGVVIAVALGHAIVAAARREAPDFYAWLAAQFGTSGS